MTSAQPSIVSSLKRLSGLAVALVVLIFANAAVAQTYNYIFTTPNYTNVTNASGPCSIGDCVNFTGAQNLVVTLRFSAPLAANLPVADRTATLVSYTINDGVRITEGHSDGAAIWAVNIGTDAAGIPNSWNISLQRVPPEPYDISTDQTANETQRVSSYIVNMIESRIMANSNCSIRDPGPVTNPGPGRCQLVGTETVHGSSAVTGIATVSTVFPPTIPTLSEWTMILLAVLLVAGAGLILVRRRAQTEPNLAA